MVHIPAGGEGGGGSSETISVSTDALKATAPAFHNVGQQVDSVKQTINGSVQLGTGEMFLVMEFAKLASLLEQLQSRISMAMQCAAGGLNRMGTSLEIAAELYDDNEDVLRSTFTQLEDDPMPWHIGIQLSPGVFNVKPGGVSPQPTPTPQPNPGINTPLNPSGNPLPGINPLEPDIP